MIRTTTHHRRDQYNPCNQKVFSIQYYHYCCSHYGRYALPKPEKFQKLNLPLNHVELVSSPYKLNKERRVCVWSMLPRTPPVTAAEVTERAVEANKTTTRVESFMMMMMMMMMVLEKYTWNVLLVLSQIEFCE